MAETNDNLTPEMLVSGHLDAVKGFCLARAKGVDDAEEIVVEGARGLLPLAKGVGARFGQYS